MYLVPHVPNNTIVAWILGVCRVYMVAPCTMMLIAQIVCYEVTVCMQPMYQAFRIECAHPSDDELVSKIYCMASVA